MWTQLPARNNHTGIVNADTQQMAEEKVGEGENEEGESNYRVSYNMPLHCTGNLHHQMGHKRFQYSDITVAMKTDIAKKCSLNSS